MTDQRTVEELMSERVPTVFTFYGYMSHGKRGGRGYTTRAKSLEDALDDLERDEGYVENGYLVWEAFVMLAEGEPVIHVLLMPYMDNIRDDVGSGRDRQCPLSSAEASTRPRAATASVGTTRQEPAAARLASPRAPRPARGSGTWSSPECAERPSRVLR